MAKNTIKQPTLYLRSAHFIDNLREMTGQGFTRLEKRIRENQYEAFNLDAPGTETVRDYFRLYLPVAFETPQTAKSPPWLLATELEVPQSSAAFFHPIFDLLFGPMESAVFWDMQIKHIPIVWIEQAEARGDIDTASEWRRMNENTRIRKHRKRQATQIDTLSFIHLTLMRLPKSVREILFERKGLSPSWTRRYALTEIEIAEIKSIKNIDGLAVLLGLAKEGAEIGDLNRFHQAKNALIENLHVLDEIKSCRRICQKLKDHIIYECGSMCTRRYSQLVHFGFGLPSSWQAYFICQHIAHEEQKFISKLTK